MSVERHDHPSAKPDALSQVLGWTSLGIGGIAAAIPGPIARVLAIDKEERAATLIRYAGIRDVVVGAGLLVGPRRTIWARFTAELMDTSAFVLLRSRSSGRARTYLTALAVGSAAAGAVDLYAAVRGRSRQHGGVRPGPLHLRASVVVNRPVATVYAYWRDVANLPTFMTHLRSVTVESDGQRSHWEAISPLPKPIRWNAQLTGDEENRRLSWKSTPGSDVANAGTVHFAATDSGGTEVRVDLHYDVPGGKLGGAIASLFGEAPEQQVADDLQRLKRVLERSASNDGTSGAYSSSH